MRVRRLSSLCVVTVGILPIVNHWNDFFCLLIYLNSRENMTVSVGMCYFNSIRGAANCDMGEVREHLFMAAALMSMAPMVAFFFVARRYFVQGMVMSGLKG